MTKRRISIGDLPTGPHNAITDVPGVRVGHCTIIEDEPVFARTGVTAIFPSLKDYWEASVFAAFHAYNGHGEVAGAHWLNEAGVMNSPVVLTSTWSLGIVRDTMFRESTKIGIKNRFHNPVVGETNDFFLNDGPNWPVKPGHVVEAVKNAKNGPVAEGNVGAGTGVLGYLFKGGIGTASKVVETAFGTYTVGALVQSNHGQRQDLYVDGVPVGKEIGMDVVPPPKLSDNDPYLEVPPFLRKGDDEQGSIQIIIATDAPLLPIQCRRLAQRAVVGLGRVGGVGNNGSGDFVVAFSTGNIVPSRPTDTIRGLDMHPNEKISPLFSATIEATETAIVNSLLAAEDMVGRNGNRAYALPHDLLEAALAKYGRDWKEQ